MPRCDGLPNEPCPKGANDRYVKSTQGNLFLCRSWEEIRFPPVAAKPKGGRNTRNVKLNPPAPAVQPIMPRNVQRAGCDRSNDRADCIQCDICDSIYDQQCSTLPKDVFATLLTIIQCCGWVCYNCRTYCRAKLDKIQIHQWSEVKWVGFNVPLNTL